MKILNIAATFVACSLVSSTQAGALLISTDKYMLDRHARVSEIRSLCKAPLDRVKVDSGKQTMLFVCAFDVSHTTGFNASTQDAGVLADLHEIQTMDYTFEMMSVLHSVIKKCLRDLNVADEDAWQSDKVTYCVAMRGYDYGKRYGLQHLKTLKP